jgi:Fic family protein
MNRFTPNLRPSSILQAAIERANTARQAILLAPLNPRVETALRFETSAEATHYSTAIEGNPLTLEEVRKLLSNTPILRERNVELEVKNYKRGLDQIAQRWTVVTTPVSVDSILELHGLVTDTLEPKARSGKFRKDAVYVFDSSTNAIIHEGDPHLDVRARIVALCDWLERSKRAPDIHPITRAAIAHLEFVRIHPFMDGNGRTARLLQTLLLAQVGWDVRGLLSLDGYHRRDLARYYGLIAQCIQQRDWTLWAEYIAQGVAEMLEIAFKRVQAATEDEIPTLNRSPLNDRQLMILSLLERPFAHVTNATLQALTRVTAVTAARDLAGLLEMGLIVRRGAGRGTYYERA